MEWGGGKNGVGRRERKEWRGKNGVGRREEWSEERWGRVRREREEWSRRKEGWREDRNGAKMVLSLQSDSVDYPKHG